ncbi:AMP deaminase [Plasmodium falciparum IGH-CR14]|uniref:AMP deaminase n=1 Tax=Plasmodium falciparum IGH-CR14 TaxID=580059 RepID=A0A0L1IGI3_PLAFA|nr:AMP deaminase [Plasmodium falciparum IGH-CR14]
MRLPNKNDGHKTVPQKEKGWNNLYETVVNISSKSSIKYDEYTLLNKDLNKLQTCNRFSFTLTSTGAVTKEQLEVSRKLIRLCNLRDTYIKKFQDIDTCLVESKSLNKNYKSKNIDDYESSEPIYNPYNVKILKNCNAFINFVDGIFFVHWDPHTDEGPSSRDMCVESNKLANHRNIKSAEDYLSSIQEIMNVVQDPACKSFCFQRLKYLEKKFDFHIMFNGPLELSETRDIKHRDFYNIRKVDVHVHHSACMQQKELLRFIREKYRTEPNTVVYINEKREMLTLKSIFDEELKSTAYESTIDTLGVNALGNCFHRFDLFNEKYNPFGQKLLRDIFLKTDNYIEGRYLAEITKKQIKILERSKYQHVEWRISIYGKNKNEWLKISKWVLNNQLSSIRVRWMIQVPRLYHIYKKMKLINTFADFLSNIFSPCFEAIKNPEENKEIFIFLHQIVGWDSVDDESIISNYTLKGGELPTPDKYVSEHNPPYSYYAYYMYINIRMLNEFMISRNMRPMAFRPHCGEIGNMSHLACMFLLADRINHGINLRKSPVLLYLYYLKQIGLALSPLSNNALFLHIDKNPFKRFFKIGLNVTLSTDDPLMFHFTDEPLLEEYSICAHTWKLSTVDLCEIARASVIQSGYEPAFKKHWLGDEDGFFNFQNDPNKTNLSNTRMVYRRNTLEEEIKNIERLASYSSNN